MQEHIALPRVDTAYSDKSTNLLNKVRHINVFVFIKLITPQLIIAEKSL